MLISSVTPIDVLTEHNSLRLLSSSVAFTPFRLRFISIASNICWLIQMSGQSTVIAPSGLHRITPEIFQIK